MSKTTLKAVSRTQGNNRALKEGRVTLADFDLEYSPAVKILGKKGKLGMTIPSLLHSFH